MCVHTHARTAPRSAPTTADGTAPAVSWLSVDVQSPRLTAVLQALAGATVYVRHRRFCGVAELLHAHATELVVHPLGRGRNPVALARGELYHLHVHS